MSVWNWLCSRLAGLRSHRNRVREVDRELRSHLELESEELQESGLPAEEARYAAHRAFGNLTLVTEDVRAIWSLMWLEGFIRDLKYGTRVLRKNLGFTTVAVLTLALGIGANTAIFSAIDALMLRPLPFSHAERLVRRHATKNNVTIEGFYAGSPSPPDVRDYAQASHTFQKMVVYDAWRKNVSYGDAASEPQQMSVGLVPAAYFEVLEVKPLVGWLFSEEENQEGKNHVAAISAHLWKTRYAGDPAILGRKIRINDELYTIVALMPDVIPQWMEARHPGLIEVWTPFAFADVWSEASRRTQGYDAVGRLKPGVSLEQAQADLSTIAAEEFAASRA